MEEEIRQSVITLAEETNGEQALKVLYMAAYFAPAKSIHLDMFLCLFNDTKEQLDAAILLLKKKSLIESHDEQAFFVRNIIQNEIRIFLKQNGKEKDVLSEAVDLQIFHLLKDEVHPNYVNHALFLLNYVRESDELVKISLSLPNHIITALRKHNRLGEAYVFGKEALEFLEKTVGEGHAETLTLRHNLATVLEAGGQHAKAIKVLQELNEKDLKYSSVKEITKSLVARARLLCELSKHRDALPLYQILIGDKTVEHTFDCEILTAWHDYALLLSDLGRHSEAIDILQDILCQERIVITVDDQYGVVTRLALATVYLGQGKYIQAMKQLKEVLYENRKYFGEFHTDTLRAERDIGIVLLQKGDFEEALKRLEGVETKFKKMYPESHPDILCTRANIIFTLINLEKYDEALRLAKDVYEAYVKIYGEKHSEPLHVKHKIGDILLHQGKRNEAVKIFREVYEGFRDVFGPDHYKTANSKSLLEVMGSYSWFSGTRTLHEAAQRGHLNEIVSLVENKADVNMEDSEGRRPLHYAAANGHINVAKYLLEMGAMYNVEDLKNRTPCQLASDERMKNLFISINNLFEDIKRGILMHAAGDCRLLSTKDKNGYTLLHWAVNNSHKCVVQQLVDAGADRKSVSLKGQTPLYVASLKGNKEIAEILFQSLTGNYLTDLVNSKTEVKGNTALHVAAENNNLAMVKCLLMYGASYDIQNKDGRTPVQLSTYQTIGDLLIVIHEMFTSVREGNSEAITRLKLLINDDLAIVSKARDSRGHTLLQVAIRNQHRDIINGLLELLLKSCEISS